MDCMQFLGTVSLNGTIGSFNTASGMDCMQWMS